MPSKETRAQKRQKKATILGARRRAAAQRRVYREVSKYMRKIEAVNARILEAKKRQPLLLEEYREARRQAIEALRSEVAKDGDVEVTEEVKKPRRRKKASEQG